MAPLREGGAAELAAVFARLLRDPGAGQVLNEVLAAARQVDVDGALGTFAATARELGGWYPGDPGVLAALLLNRVVLRRHEAMYLPAGNLHAYLRGSGIEIMANSDNVLRGGLTAKHVDVEELLKIIDFTPGRPEVLAGVAEAPGVWRYPTPAPEFALWRLEPTGALTLPGVGSGRALLVVEGAATISVAATSQRLELGRGEAAFLTAEEAVTLQGQGTAFLAASGI
ncbi:MAG: hypothetical protein ACLGIF_08065 [Actinomycetes bacterium]